MASGRPGSGYVLNDADGQEALPDQLLRPLEGDTRGHPRQDRSDPHGAAGRQTPIGEPLQHEADVAQISEVAGVADAERPVVAGHLTGASTCVYSSSPGLGVWSGRMSPSMQKLELFGRSPKSPP